MEEARTDGDIVAADVDTVVAMSIWLDRH